MILLIWFRTEAFIEYCKVFSLPERFCFVKDYEEKKTKDDATLNYSRYLIKYHNNFFTRLITCPICTAVWIALIVAIFSGKACVLPVAMIGGLILYLTIDRLLG